MHYLCNLAGHINFFFLWQILPHFAQSVSVDILRGYKFRPMGAAISVDGWSGYVEIGMPSIQPTEVDVCDREMVFGSI